MNKQQQKNIDWKKNKEQLENKEKKNKLHISQCISLRLKMIYVEKKLINLITLIGKRGKRETGEIHQTYFDQLITNANNFSIYYFNN